MKTSHTHFWKAFGIFSVVILLLTGACNQTGSNESGSQVTGSGKAVKVEKPKTGIQEAILAGDLEIVMQHIEAGTNINKKEPMSGSTPLITAATFGHEAIASALINANADLDVKNNEGSTALHAAAFFCRVEIVQMLIDAGADKTIKNNYAATPRESVTGPFEEIKPIYELFQQQMGQFGLEMDMKEIEMTRPVIAMMLQ